jgi:branched-chain amino acid aminotransferase
VHIVEALARSQGIPFERRPMDRTELLVADELALCGTLAEVIPVRAIAGLPLAKENPVLRALQKRYFEAVRGIDPHPSVELATVAKPAATTATAGRRGSEAAAQVVGTR